MDTTESDETEMGATEAAGVWVEFVGPVEVQADVARFFDALLAAGVRFHPDEALSDTIERGTGRRTFSPEEGSRLDALMSCCFSVAGEQVYQEATAAFARHDLAGEEQS